MSGVRSGSRLQQLEALRGRITHALHAAHRRGDPITALHQLAAAVDDAIRAAGGTPPAPTVPTRPGPPPPTATAADIRAWAVTHGLMPPGRRGRIPQAVHDAYAVHQQLDRITRKAGTP